MIRPTLLRFSVAIALAAPGLAQGETKKPGPGQLPPGVELPPVNVHNADQRQSDLQGPLPKSGDVTMTVEPVGLAGAEGGTGPGVTNSHAYFTAFASTTPRRLAPGQTGVLHVLVALTKDTVVQPDGHIAVQMTGKGPWVLGSAERVPARPAQYAPKFRGQTVYDDTIEFRIPITVDAKAKYKKYLVAGTVAVDVTHGTTGTPVGRVQGPVQGPIVVGERIPTPGVHRTARTTRVASDPASKGSTVPAANVAAQPGSPENQPQGVRNAPGGTYENPPEPEGNAVPTATEPGPSSSPGFSILPVAAGGGLALAVIVVLLLVRRRR